MDKDEFKSKFKKGLKTLGKKIGEGVNKAGVMMKDIGQNVKVRIDERRELRESDPNAEKILPDIFCGFCGTHIAVELREMLFNGQEIICESCGKTMKIKDNLSEE